MKWIIEILRSTLIHLIYAIFYSAIFTFLQWIVSFMGLCNAPTLKKFLYGALSLFIIFYLYHISSFLITLYHMHKDPMFKEAHIKTGISWSNYKKLKK